MHKLIVLADPMREIEIYEVTEANKMHKISQLRLPQESVEFIKNYSDSIHKKIQVIYKGPKDYIRYFVNQVNNFNFVKAYMNEIGD